MIPILTSVVRDTLATHLFPVGNDPVISFLHPECVAVRPTSQPKAFTGQAFVAISPGTWTLGPSNDLNDALDEYLGVNIGITLRTGEIPNDRMGEELFREETRGKFLQIVRPIVRIMAQQRWNILVECNARHVATPTPDVPNDNAFCEPLRLLNANATPTPVGPDWFFAEPPTRVNPKDYGHVILLNYGRCRIIQKHTSTNFI